MPEYRDVVRAVKELYRRAVIELGDDVVELLRRAYEEEENEVARVNLENILRNVELARRKGVPICQDTGVPVVFVELGRDVELDFCLRDAIAEGIRRATAEIPLRPNVVNPITRENSGDNTGVGMPYIDVELVEGEFVRITVMPKGAGSENCSSIAMLNPGDFGKIKMFVADVVRRACGKPCPPLFLGVGIGSTFDGCARLAKRALLKDVRRMNEFELEMLEFVNRLGIGPMGMGGKTTVLAVLTEIGYCHTASLPVAVNVQCWAHRRASAVLR